MTHPPLFPWELDVLDRCTRYAHKDGPIRFYRGELEYDLEQEQENMEEEEKRSQVSESVLTGISPIFAFSNPIEAGDINIKGDTYTMISQHQKFTPDVALPTADGSGVMLYATQRRNLDGARPHEGGYLLQAGLKVDNKTIKMVLEAGVRGNIFPTAMIPLIQ